MRNGREYIEKSTRYKILKRQNFKCAICGKKLKYNINSNFGEEVAHIDHIHPVSKEDGTYLGRLNNLQALCPGCNISKGNKGKVRTEEQRKTTSERTKEAMKNPEIRKKIS